MVLRKKPQAPRPPEEGTYLAGGSCGVSGRALAVVLSLAALLLRKLCEPSAERRGAGLEFWGSNSSSGMTSSQRAPRKPERHTQSWGRLQEPLFWHGGWHTARETGRGVRAGARGLTPTCQKGPLPFAAWPPPLRQEAICWPPKAPWPHLSLPATHRPPGEVCLSSLDNQKGNDQSCGGAHTATSSRISWHCALHSRAHFLLSVSLP